MSSSAAGAARSFLFAPGSRPKLLQRAFEAGADAVVLDLEDSVPEREKEAAREAVAACLSELAGQSPVEVHVRVNGVQTGRTQEDIAAVVLPGVSAIRLPKAERADDVGEVSGWIAQAERRQGLSPGSVRLDLTIETAQGVAGARELASCDARVGLLVFGQADFLADVGAELGKDRLETLYARSELVIASRLAGLMQPVEGAHTRLRDPEGLEAAALAARRLGFFGMSAIHPEQIPVIHAVFTPSAEEVQRARELLAAYQAAEAQGSGALRMADSRFVDRPVALRSMRIVALAEREKEGHRTP